MKKLLTTFALVCSLAASAFAQTAGSSIPVDNVGARAGMTVPLCTAYSIVSIDSSGALVCNPASVVNGTVTTAGRSTLTIRDTIPGDGTQNFFNVTGTFPTVLTATTFGIQIDMNSAGSSSFTSIGTLVRLLPGYTGSSNTVSLQSSNSAASTKENTGISGAASATTTGVNGGIIGSASLSSTWNSGGRFSAGIATNSPALNTGLVSYAQNATVNVAGAFFIGPITTTPTAPTIPTSAAVYEDNLASTANIRASADNGTLVDVLQNDGSRWSKMATKALTLGGGAVTFVRVAVTSNSFQGGFIDYCADANDATDYQTRCGIVPFSIVNKGGTETCTVATTGAATESVAVSVGTFTVAFTTDTATPTNACDFQANGTSSLTETVMRINYTVRLVGNAATTVTPQ